MILAGDDLTVHKFKVYAFSCTVDWLHLTMAMLYFLSLLILYQNRADFVLVV